MPTFRQNLLEVKRARRQLENAESRLYEAKLDIQKDKNPASLESVRADLASLTAAGNAAEVHLVNAIKALHGTGDFRTTTRNLLASAPVILFPVRIETRFVTVRQREQLFVRVYPDDIHVESFEERLSVREIEVGQNYWRVLVAANRNGAVDIEESKQDAWRALTSKPGVQRGLWIAKQTQPTNWQPDLAVQDNDIRFPAQKKNKLLDWTRAPKTRILPDRFVLNIYKGNRIIKHKVGRPIPDTVFLGPDPFLAEDAFKHTGKRITLDDSFAWVSDFNKAVAKGLGFKIPVTDNLLNHGQIDRIMVLGLMVSADAAESKRLLEEHIKAHRYSRKGFSLLPQGTPTNNTDSSNSAYTRNYDDLPKGYFDASDETPLSTLPTSDGFALAQALGIDPDVLSDANNAEKKEVAEAQWMNQALYPGTIGHFLEVLSEPALDKTAQREIREFFVDNVSATGPLSSIRVGDQPYGVLLTSDLNQWQEPDSDRFAKKLAKVLRVLQSKWDSLRRGKVAHVNKRGDASKLMLEILGLNPGSVRFKQRLGHLNDLPMSATNIADPSSDFTNKQKKVVSLLKSGGYSSTKFPLISAISFYKRKSYIAPRFMVDRKKVLPTRFLDKLGSQKLNFIDWLTQVKSTKSLDDHALPGARPPRSVLYFLLRHSVLLSLQKAALNLYKKKGFDFKRGALEKSLHNFDSKTNDLTSWEILKGRPKKVDAQALNIDKPMGDHLLALPTNAQAVVELGKVRTAMRKLAKLSTARLYQCLVDHLDLASYRLDAWQMGLFYRRLKANRESRATGSYIGAYGWVENLRPAPKATVNVPDQLKPGGGKPVFRLSNNAGFVHTPSLNHATAAGILHAGYRNNANASDPDAFAVNLSSERVRRALSLYQGVQNNQPLEALLGYQFERALHNITSDNLSINLNQYILDFREAYPIESASVPQAGSEAQETIPPYPVVNGLKLISATNQQIANLGVQAPHRAIIRREIDRLEDSLDAIGDLLTSESAYQMVQGKMDRLAGVLNSFKNINLPPDLEVNKTPRSTQLTVNNKLCISIGHQIAIGAGSGWGPRHTPRSRFEPDLNSWLAGQIGDPKRVVCRASLVDEEGNESSRRKIKLSDLHLQPIDLVYAIGIDVKSGARELEQRIFRHYTTTVSVPEQSKVVITFNIPDAGASRNFAQVLPLLTYLRQLITTSRPANAVDFQPAIRDDDRSPGERHGWDLADLETRVADALGELRALRSSIASRAPNSRQPKTRTNPATLREFFGNYAQDGKPPEMLEGLHLTNSTIDKLVRFIEGAPLFGIKTSFPERVDTSKRSTLTSLLGIAAHAWAEVNRRIAAAEARQTEASSAADTRVAVKRQVAAAQEILGEDFRPVPGFFFSNKDDVRSSVAQDSKNLLEYYSDIYETSPRMALESWIQSLVPVRPAVRRLEQIRSIAEFSGGNELQLAAVQLPFKTKDHWYSVEIPEIDEATGEPIQPKHDTRSVCMVGLNEEDVNRRQQILMVDEWSEAIPNAAEVTGITYNYNQPNSSAPNAILVAIEPTNARRWSWDALTGIVDDTLKRAKSRAVEPAHLLDDAALDVLLPMTIAGFDLNESSISLDYLAIDDKLVQKMKQNNYRLYKRL